MLASPPMMRRNGLAIVFLAVVTIAFFGPAVFGGRAVFTWNMDLWLPWRASASAEDLTRPARLTDCPRQFYVMRHLATESLRQGHVPLWNRWIYAGTPFLANYQPAVFFPTNLLLAWSGLPVADQMTVSALVHFFVGAAGTYVFLRVLAISPLAAFLGAILFAWSPIQAARTGIGTMPASWCWLPWALACTRLWFDRGQSRWWVGIAASLALSGLGGHFQVHVFAVYAWLMYVLIEGLCRRPSLPGRRWAGAGTAGAVALLVTAIHLAPTLEFAPISQEAKNTREELISGTLHPWALGKMVVPDLLGHPADRNNATHHLRVGNGFYFQTEHSTVVYVGILPLLLAGVVLLNPGDHRRASVFALLLAAGGILFSLPTPVLDLGRHLPGLDFSRPDRATFVYGAGLAFLAAIGADRLLGEEGPGWARASNRFAIAIGAGALGFALLIAFAGAKLLPADVLQTIGRPYLTRAGSAAALAAFASLALVLLRVSGRIPGRVFAFASIVLLAADAGLAAERLNVMQPKKSIYRAEPANGSIAFLRSKLAREGPFRLMRFEVDRGPYSGVFPPSCPAVYGLEDVLGFDSLNTVLYQELIDAVDPEIIPNRGNFRGTSRPEALSNPILDLLGARYVLAAGVPPLPGLDLVHRSDLSVYENPGALPRAFFVDEVIVVASPDTLLAAMASRSFRPDRFAFLSEPVAALEDLPPADDAGTSNRVVELDIPRDEEVRITVEASKRRLLVLADSWYPGWTVHVDGKPREILRVDHALRGVVVEPGDRVVVFTYRPSSFRLGVLFSSAGLVALGLGAWALRRKDS